MSYRVVIPTAGIGSRLGDLTKFLNKSLVSIAHRPTLCHTIEQFPVDCEYVIALGYKGHLVREFINLAYPDRTFYFVEVEPYIGNGSGLGHSLLCCESYLQQPFIFISCDTLVSETIPCPDYDWMGYAISDDISAYRTISVLNNCVDKIFEKGSINLINLHPYIGLAGIHNFSAFWHAMHDGDCAAIEQGEAYGLRYLLNTNQINAHLFTWFDTGTLSSLEYTRNKYKDLNEPNILEKQNEAIWFVGDRVIKFSEDKSFISNRVKRSSILSEFTPKILNSSDHMYAYKKVDGDVFSNVVTLPLFKKLLASCQDFWKLADLTSDERSHFLCKCKTFYYEKTLQRLDLFYSNFDKVDAAQPINGEPMPLLSNLLENVNWAYITAGLPGRFHGDFHFENILLDSSADSFVFLDWRQDFGGDLSVGDIYYDLAKLLHGSIVSHELIAQQAFTIVWNNEGIEFDLHRRQILVECEDYLSSWCQDHGFDYSKVRILTALIYLNIAALHHYPYSLLLYSLGKRMLNVELKKQFEIIPRNRDVILGGVDLEFLYEFKDFPVYMGCVEDDISQDLCANMRWTISRNSGAIQLNPLLPLDVVYPSAHGSGCVGKLWMNHHSSLALFIKKYNPDNVLEIGGAHGILSKFYHSLAPDTIWTIVEPNPTPDDSVKARFINNFFDDKFRFDEPIDLIVHSHVFEHVYYPQEFIEHISRFLSVGKYMIFSLPNMEEMLKNNYSNCLNFEHTVLLSAPYIDFLLKQNGFRVLETQNFLDDHSIFYACIREKSTNSSQLPSNLYDYNKKLFLDYIEHHVDLVQILNSRISKLSTSNKVYLFGAHVFSQYLIGFGLDTSHIECILDNDANKHAKRLYGSSLRVSSPRILFDEDEPVVILKAGVYNDEIKADILSNINQNTIFLE